MQRDYAKKYTGTTGAQKVQRKDRPGGTRKNWLWKTVGLVISLAMLSGLGSSVWFGWKIRHGLAELTRHQQHGLELVQERQELLENRKKLTSSEEIEAAARKMGLYPPEESQLKRP